MWRVFFIAVSFCFSSLFAGEGMVIILNGPSAVGKSSIQKALQEKSDKTFLRIGIDTFFDALIETPDLGDFEKNGALQQYTKEGEHIRGIERTLDKDGNIVVPLQIGPAGDQIIHGMHRAIDAYARSGNNVIVDYIQYKQEWSHDLYEAVRDRNVLFVGVHAPLDIIETRERERNTSPIGHSRSHYYTVHAGMNYDLEVDTSLSTPEECAQEILNFIATRDAAQLELHSQ